MSTVAVSSETKPRTWAIAWALTVVLHVLIVTGMQLGQRWTPVTPKPVAPEPLHLTFVGQPPASAAPKQPTMFTELPADRADKPPKQADFLSNVTSRARDRVPGGDQSLPRMSGETDFPSVAMQPGRTEPSPASPPQQQATPPPPSTDATGAADVLKPGAGSTTIAPIPHPAAPPSPAYRGIPYKSDPSGNSDIQQGEMDNPGGNAALTGDVTLNTTEWDWAPWIQRFGRRLMRAWYAPQAYYLGVLKEGGWAVVEMEITHTGEVVRMDVLEQQGHPSLILAATSALKAISPMEKLPADFPEKTLILRVRMVYPRFRTR